MSGWMIGKPGSLTGSPYLGRVGKDVGYDAHGGLGGVDERVAHHKLFQNVVLDRARELFQGHALLPSRPNVHGHHGQDGTIHGH